jgi:hypothetical protein
MIEPSTMTTAEIDDAIERLRHERARRGDSPFSDLPPDVAFAEVRPKWRVGYNRDGTFGVCLVHSGQGWVSFAFDRETLRPLAEALGSASKSTHVIEHATPR